MSFFKKLVKGMLGMDDSAAKQAKRQAQLAEEEMRRQTEAQILNNQNEMSLNTLVKTNDVGTLGLTPDTRRRRVKAGSPTSGLGLGF